MKSSNREEIIQHNAKEKGMIVSNVSLSTRWQARYAVVDIYIN